MSEEKKFWIQCHSIFRSGVTVVFCTRKEGHGHDGDHRGIRTQWNKKGRVRITLPLDV